MGCRQRATKTKDMVYSGKPVIGHLEEATLGGYHKFTRRHVLSQRVSAYQTHAIRWGPHAVCRSRLTPVNTPVNTPLQKSCQDVTAANVTRRSGFLLSALMPTKNSSPEGRFVSGSKQNGVNPCPHRPVYTAQACLLANTFRSCRFPSFISVFTTAITSWSSLSVCPHFDLFSQQRLFIRLAKQGKDGVPGPSKQIPNTLAAKTTLSLLLHFC